MGSCSTPLRRWPLSVPVVLALIAGMVAVSVVKAPFSRAEASYPHYTDMNVRRSHHTASHLADGKVLVAGGSAGSTGVADRLAPLATETAEVYDPAADSWQLVAPMPAPRMKHTATVLEGPACRTQAPAAQCGAVLVTGGYNDGLNDVVDTSTFTSNLYSQDVDAPLGLWALGADMAFTRAEHTATLLDGPECHVAVENAPSYCGKVLIVGGFGVDRSAPDPGPSVLDRVVASLEIYDPETGQFTVAGRLRVPRARHAATLLADGRVAIIGGVKGKTLTAAANYVGDVEIYDPKIVYDPAFPAAALSSAAPMLDCPSTYGGPRTPCSEFRRPTATLLPDGTVLMLSGRGRDTPDNWVQIFDPAGDGGRGAWARAGWSGTVTVGSHSAVLLPNSGRVLAFASNVRSGAGLVGADKTLPAFVYDLDDRNGIAYPCPASANCNGPTQGGETLTVLGDGTVLQAGGEDHVPGSGTFGAILSAAVRIDSVFEPGRPRGVTASRSGSETTLSWSPPNIDGGAAISHYEVKGIANEPGQPAEVKVVQGAGAGSARLAGTLLTHDYEVRAVNRIGKGLPGIPGSLNVPLAPTAVEGVAGNGTASVHWVRPAEDVPPPEDGSAVTGYEVLVTPAPADGAGIMSVDGADVTTAEFTNLRNGTAYVSPSWRGVPTGLADHLCRQHQSFPERSGPRRLSPELHRVIGPLW
ncbi:MAG TPA: hypothetical protein VNA57_03860 [Acidimicrobiales bacterium]|nr:hypothetical protein [Acidimicrobiales bacterium]